MNDHMRRIYDLERQLPERNFAKDHSYEEWLVQHGSTSLAGRPHTEIELQKVCERCGYREPVDVSQLARTLADSIITDMRPCEDGEADRRKLIGIIESVLAGRVK